MDTGQCCYQRASNDYVVVTMRKSLYTAVLVALASALAYNLYFTYDYVLVELDKGLIRGIYTSSWRGDAYYSFKGIPYAKPPVGELRFKEPEEETAWAGVRDAVSHGSVCPHVDIVFGFNQGDEDCLFVNVYTPTLRNRRLPVMVFIHGGGYFEGSADDGVYAPDYFMGAGVVLVTMNYRLGALGFLSTGDDAAPGNAGMKDQVAALRWVKRNVAKFGGDPDNVTLFGESAGGAAVHLHVLSPMSKGLFVRAISQSGSAMNAWSLNENIAESTLRLAEVLGAGDLGGNTEKALRFLKTVPYRDIVEHQGNLMPVEEQQRKIGAPLLFTPTIERGVKSKEIFLPDHPSELLRSGRFNDVPFIIGHTSHEGYFFWREMTNPKFMAAAFDDTERYVPYDITNQELRNDLGKSIRKFYFDDKPVSHENISSFVDLYTDNFFVAGTRMATKLQVDTAKSPVYFYIFSYDGRLNLVKYFFNIGAPGCAHADELGYMFYQKLTFWRKPVADSEDEFVLDTTIRLWTNFAKYGEPTPAGDPLSWKPITKDKFNYLNISGLDMKLGVNPYPERAAFWAEAYKRHFALQH